ncbi:MAG: hypothetical protein AB197_00440 [Parcubacteria bacterium C7867-002]|nr:MAG: hypothetical protein AB197_00440 [Parcubacteria bacterium C7867-002]
MKSLRSDRIPRKYQLSWNSHKTAIVISIHTDCIRNAQVLTPDLPIVKHLTERHMKDPLLDSFEGNLQKDSFGFNRLIRKTNEIGDYVKFSVDIPRIKIETNFLCEECGGTGKRFEHETACNYCGETGKKSVINYKEAFMITSSLNILFNILECHEHTSARESQHLRIYILSEPEQHGSSLGGIFGIDLSNYLASESSELIDTILPEVTRAMRQAYNHTGLASRYDFPDSIRGELRDGYLMLECPGDACGIHSSHHGRRQNMGHEFTCHNVDQPAQGLTLLTGIASLVGQADLYIPNLTH